jgi:hypothetical protein
VAAHRERDRPAAPMELIGQLHSCGRTADDEHAAIGEVAG